MEVWLDFQEARAAMFRIMGNAMLALPLNFYVISRTLLLLQTNQSGQLPEIQRKGPGHPGLPDRKLLPLQAWLSYPRRRRRGRTVCTS